MIARDDAEDSSGNIVHGQEQGSEQIEGLDWDMEKLLKEIDCCLLRLRDGGRDDNDDNDVLLALCDEQQLTDLNQRLALCRIRARESRYRELDDESLTAIYPLSNLESNGYYEHYECNLEWFFDPEYCNYADLQDCQRLMLRNKGGYEDWEYYRKTCSTLEGDQQFIQFWEKLSSKTELLYLYLTDNSSELPRIERLVFYHSLKIAEGLPHVLMTLVRTGFEEFKWSLRFDHTWYKYYTGFIFNMWELVTKQKMNIKDAFRHIHNEGKYDYCTHAWKAEFEKDEPNLYMLDEFYKPYLDRIGETATEDYAYQDPVIMDAVKTIVMKPKTYYDYVKKKLDIAKEIGLVCRNP